MAQTFEELIGLHLDGLYGAAVCFTLDEHEAEALLQEAAIRAFHQLSGRDADFRREMLEILVSTYLQRQRRMGRDPFASRMQPVAEMLSEGPHVPFQPFPEIGTEGYRLLKSWMKNVWPDLDPGERLIVWLVDVERLRHARVATLIGRDEDDVRSRHYRARLTLSRGAAQVLARFAAESAEA